MARGAPADAGGRKGRPYIARWRKLRPPDVGAGLSAGEPGACRGSEAARCVPARGERRRDAAFASSGCRVDEARARNPQVPCQGRNNLKDCGPTPHQPYYRQQPCSEYSPQAQCPHTSGSHSSSRVRRANLTYSSRRAGSQVQSCTVQTLKEFVSF